MHVTNSTCTVRDHGTNRLAGSGGVSAQDGHEKCVSLVLGQSSESLPSDCSMQALRIDNLFCVLGFAARSPAPAQDK